MRVPWSVGFLTGPLLIQGRPRSIAGQVDTGDAHAGPFRLQGQDVPAVSQLDGGHFRPSPDMLGGKGHQSSPSGEEVGPVQRVTVQNQMAGVLQVGGELGQQPDPVIAWPANLEGQVHAGSPTGIGPEPLPWLGPHGQSPAPVSGGVGGDPAALPWLAIVRPIL